MLEAIRALGIAGGPVFAALWWLERSERRACQAENKDLVRQVLTVTSQATVSVNEVTKAVAAVEQLVSSFAILLGKRG